LIVKELYEILKKEMKAKRGNDEITCWNDGNPYVRLPYQPLDFFLVKDAGNSSETNASDFRISLITPSDLDALEIEKLLQKK